MNTHTQVRTHAETHAETHTAHTLTATGHIYQKPLSTKHAQVGFFKMSATHDARLREIDGLGAKPTKEADSQRASRAAKRSKVNRGNIKETRSDFERRSAIKRRVSS